jgi:hypothetical protein
VHLAMKVRLSPKSNHAVGPSAQILEFASLAGERASERRPRLDIRACQDDAVYMYDTTVL